MLIPIHGEGICQSYLCWECLQVCLLMTSLASSPFMLSWVIGSRRILRPRFLLAAFVDHFFPSWRRKLVAIQDQLTCLQLFHWLRLKSTASWVGLGERGILSGFISGVLIEAIVFVVLVTSRVPSANCGFLNRFINWCAKDKRWDFF